MPTCAARSWPRTCSPAPRAPGSRLPASACELDHVQPWTDGLTGGPTGEPNLAYLDKKRHENKTNSDLIVAINDRRDLTFTTTLGQVITTRTHDYRDLDDPTHRLDRTSAPADGISAPRRGDDGADDAETAPDLQERLNELLTDALAERGPDALLANPEDNPEHPDDVAERQRQRRRGASERHDLQDTDRPISDDTPPF